MPGFACRILVSGARLTAEMPQFKQPAWQISTAKLFPPKTTRKKLNIQDSTTLTPKRGCPSQKKTPLLISRIQGNVLGPGEVDFVGWSHFSSQCFFTRKNFRGSCDCGGATAHVISLSCSMITLPVHLPTFPKPNHP